MERREHRWQPGARGAFQRPEPQDAAHRAAAQLLFGQIGHLQQPLGVSEQCAARIGQHQAAALATEQRDAEPLLELLDPRGHVGGDTVQLTRRTCDAALPHHAAEDVQVVEFASFS